MEIRPITPKDLDLLSEIDGTVASNDYLHVDRDGEGFAVSWKIQERPLRERLVRPYPIDDEQRFAMKMIATGADEGIAIMAEHDGLPVALAVGTPDPARGTLRLVDLRVDFDCRRQGLATALIFMVVTEARQREFRAVVAETTADNLPAAKVLAKCGFELAGLDERRISNHDLVKESVTLFWYVSLD